MSRRLIVNNGQRERELVLVGTLVVGRDPMCDISDDDALLSRRHAEFVVNIETVTVRDLGSRNGVFVNGRKVAEGTIKPGDVMRIGHLELHYVADDALLTPELADTLLDSDDARFWPGPPNADAGASPAVVAAPVVAAARDARQASPGFVEPTGPVESRRDPDSRDAMLAGSGTAGVTPDQSLLLRLPGSVPAATARQASAPPATAAHAPAPSAGGEPARAPRAAKGSWSTFVFTRVAMLSAVVFAACLIPLFVQRGNGRFDGGSFWLALPIVVALIATYGVGALISGRTIQALTMLHEDVELAASGNLEAVDDPLGAKPTQDLANTVNRMIARLRAEGARPRNV